MNTHEKYDQYILGTYKPNLLIVKGEGSQVWNEEGKKFLDFGVGISVCNLGHSHPAIAAAVAAQCQTVMHTSNLYMTDKAPGLAQKISQASFGGKVFFCNSGAEANEGLIKLARKWGSDQGRFEIICMEDSFHGRTLATLAATGRKKYRDGFGPDLEGFVHVPFGDLSALEAQISPKTAAVMLEPVLGEGGVRPGSKDFIQGVRQLCDKYGILMMCDEVQTGMGRTGKMFAYQHFGIEPDAMSLAKALGNGLPIGAFTVKSRYEGILIPGTHATTFGGNPVACAAGLAVFETFEKEDVLTNCNKQSRKILAFLTRLQEEFSAISDVRGLGLMIGIDVNIPTADILARALQKGLMLLTAGENTIRLLPPLNVNDQELDFALKTIKETFQELTND